MQSYVDDLRLRNYMCFNVVLYTGFLWICDAISAVLIAA